MTDPQSAKMSTSHGVIQGYNGVSVVDERNQIIVHAEARGEGPECHLLEPVVKGTRETFAAIGSDEDVFSDATLSADSGYHSKQGMEYVERSGIDAYVADRNMRQRDPAFADADRYKERHRKQRRLREGRDKRAEPKLFAPEDCAYDPQKQTCRCPAGHRLYKSGVDLVAGRYRSSRFKAPKTACRSCTLRHRCLRHPHRTEQRQVAFFHECVAPKQGPIETMKRKIDTPLGRRIYDKRLATVEPVFGNVQNKGMRRFTLRGQGKVSTQWKLFMLVHNIEKIATHRAA